MSKLQEYLHNNPAIVESMVQANPKLKFLKTWKNPYANLTPGSLHPTGMEQLYEIAVRLRNGELKDLVDSRGFVPHRHRFTSSETPRTTQSAQVWSVGFFHDSEHKDALGEQLSIRYSPKATDWILRFFEACEKFRHEDDQGLYHKEHELFREAFIDGEGGIADSVLARLGLSETKFDKKHVFALYRLCAFEASLDGLDEGFCSIFNADELEAFEYYKDLSFYWARSHGNGLGKTLAAQLLKSILLDLDGLVEKNAMKSGEPEVAHFMFGHAETLVPLVSLLGLFDDGIEWRHDMPREDWIARNFKSSHIVPFSANIGLLLHRCGEDYFIRVLHNEKELVIPGCNSVLCPFNEFKEMFEEVLSTDLEEICTIAPKIAEILT